MDIESCIETIYESAQRNTPDGEICRDILYSLWDDGTSHGCDLCKVIALDTTTFQAMSSILNHFHQTGQQLADFLSTKQITAISEDTSAKQTEIKPSTESVFVLDQSIGRRKRF
jgi:hypothetical protein